MPTVEIKDVTEQEAALERAKPEATARRAAEEVERQAEQLRTDGQQRGSGATDTEGYDAQAASGEQQEGKEPPAPLTEEEQVRLVCSVRLEPLPLLFAQMCYMPNPSRRS